MSFDVAQLLRAAQEHHQAGRFDQAKAECRRVLSQDPNQLQALMLLGTLCYLAGDAQAAADWIGRAVALAPSYPQLHMNHGLALRAAGRTQEAITEYRQAVLLKPDYAKAYINLGVALHERAELDDAVAALSTAIQFKPDDAEAHKALGNVLADQGHLDQAIASYRQALTLSPDYPEALYRLGFALQVQGEVEESIACYRRVVALDPGNALAHSNLVYSLYFQPDVDMGAIQEELGRWNERHAAPLKHLIQPHRNDPDPDRRLRIGYVSPDFRRHAIGRYVTPLLANRDPGQCEVFCYADVVRPDAMTERFAGQADVWRSIVGQSDAQVAELVREDRIDILVDLTMHMAGNRLLVFARKPAPVQVTCLAYPGSTGLLTVDYRLTDAHLDPPGANDGCYCEQSVRLPACWCCYEPPPEAPQVIPLPAATTGQITFGCFNNIRKITAQALDTWCMILRALPHSRMVLHCPEGSPRQKVRQHLARQGVDPARVQLIGAVSLAAYLGQYQGIDIALDPFPYTGGTTTCDALWMGVPVVSLAGSAAFTRGGLTLLLNMGLAELVATTPQHYVHLAVELARDLPRLAQLRSSLRQRMKASALTDGPRFARDVEAAYRQMWRKWCRDNDFIPSPGTPGEGEM